MNTLDVDEYNPGEHSVDVILQSPSVTIYFDEVVHFLVVSMRCHAMGSVTFAGALTLAPTIMKVKGIVFMMVPVAEIIDLVTIIFAATTTVMTVS